MPRVNYSKMHRANQPPKDEEALVSESGDEMTVAETEPDKSVREVYKKTTTARVRIRKGPGDFYHPTGDFVDEKKVTIVDVEDGWGLLEKFEAGRDGWVLLQYFAKQ